MSRNKNGNVTHGDNTGIDMAGSIAGGIAAVAAGCNPIGAFVVSAIAVGYVLRRGAAQAEQDGGIND